MKLTEELKHFIEAHRQDDPMRLLLDAARYPEIDVPFVVEQITARRQVRDKLPSWYENTKLIFPAKIAAEQCSSEQTALYKQRLVEADSHLCDLTGGLGVDSYYYSQKVNRVTYIERFPSYCDAARHNFSALGASNVEVIEGDGTEIAGTREGVDVFYLDPARRGEGNKRVFALTDCEPDLLSLLPVLLRKSRKVIAKISPMADIKMLLELLPEIVAIHVLSVKNECKELLLVMDESGEAAPTITCVNYTTDGSEQSFSFTLENEHNAIINCANAVGRYLYEPNASILKAGAFKSLTSSFPVKKLHVSSHLYTSDVLLDNFSGRSFIVEEVFPFSSKLCKQIAKSIPQANITVRNFPMTVEELRKKTSIKEGGEVYLFATTLRTDERVLVRCSKS